MTIKVDNVEKTCTLHIEGRVDTITAPELEAAVKENAEKCDKMVFEMSGVDYISSAGIRVVVAAHKAMAGKEGLYLENLTDNVMEIFELTGFTKALNI